MNYYPQDHTWEDHQDCDYTVSPDGDRWYCNDHEVGGE